MDAARVTSMIALREGRVRALETAAGDIARVAQEMVAGLRGGGVVYACGNGGSATQAQHFAAELVGRFRRDRGALPAFALVDNVGTLTSVSNDYDFADVFARQISGLARAGDCLLALSTSGNSENVRRACRAAREKKVRVFSLTGASGGTVAAESDVVIRVPDDDTARIQEVHIVIIHILCELVEAALFERGA